MSPISHLSADSNVPAMDKSTFTNSSGQTITAKKSDDAQRSDQETASALAKFQADIIANASCYPPIPDQELYHIHLLFSLHGPIRILNAMISSAQANSVCADQRRDSTLLARYSMIATALQEALASIASADKLGR